MKIVEPNEPGERLTFADVKPGQVFRVTHLDYAADWCMRSVGAVSVLCLDDGRVMMQPHAQAPVQIAPDAELHIGRIVSRREAVADGGWKEWGGGECPVDDDA